MAIIDSGGFGMAGASLVVRSWTTAGTSMIKCRSPGPEPGYRSIRPYPAQAGKGPWTSSTGPYGRPHPLRALLNSQARCWSPAAAGIPGKVVVLGLVTTDRSLIEPLEQIRARPGQARAAVDAGRLALSPQCGLPSRPPSPPRHSAPSPRCWSAPPGTSCPPEPTSIPA